jgi:RNA polymerase sigma-70 factor (ECF subfamily)
MSSREEGLDETILIHLALQRDEQAWHTLVNTHQEGVFRLAYLFTADPDEAEDVAQETFIRAYRSLRRFDTNRPFHPWLLSIAANLARNRIRGAKRYLAALQRIARDPALNTPVRIDQNALGEAGIVWDTVRALRSVDQQIIYLRYYLELSEEEMAESLKIPAGTVKSRLHRALQRLRARLKEVPDEGTEGRSDG